MTPLARLVAAALCCGLLAPAAAAPAPAPAFGMSEPRSYLVPTRFGAIYVEAVHPTRAGRIVAAPAILTLSPYSALGRNGDADRWVPRGYVRIYADVVGTGNSGGCWDYGGRREKATGHAVVEWIAARSWSTGRIGMIGGSYNGTTAVSTAVTRPPHLTTIVPEAAIARWYDYAYSGGIRYLYTNEFLGHQRASAVDDEGADTPLAFDFGLAIPPPLDVAGARWAERVDSTIRPCDELEHTERGYDETPDYDRFWIERDYARVADRIRIPVLVAHNWGDWNVKQEEAFDLYRALDNAPTRRLYMGSRWDDHGRPGGDYDRFVDRWMDRFLKGVRNGIRRSPAVISQTATSEGAGRWLSGRPSVREVPLVAQFVPAMRAGDYPWKLLPGDPRDPGPGAGDTTADFLSLGVNTESHANHHARNNHDWMWFESPPLARNVRIFGEPEVQIYSRVARRWVTFTPTIVDVDPADHVRLGGNHASVDPKSLVSVTRGWLDSRYRLGLDRPRSIRPGAPLAMTIVAKPQDYVFLKGHSIGLSIQTEINEWSVPKPYPCGSPECSSVRILWREGRTRLVLPVVGAPHDATALFDLNGHDH